jgi:PDZ domain-containing protein
MGRRAVAFMIGCLVVILVAVGGEVIRLPYVVMVPSLTVNTLGSVNGQPLIQVAGHRLYRTDGRLDLVTEASYGGPGTDVNLFDILPGLLSSNVAIVPQESVFPPASAVQPVVPNATVTTWAMHDAIAAALRQLKIHFSEAMEITDILKGSPAARVLRVGDVLTAVDGKPVTSSASLSGMIDGRSPGKPVTITVDRRGVVKEFAMTTVSNGQGGTEIGILTFGIYKFPFTVRLNVSACDGNGCGLMFALGLVDKLSALDLTDGKFIAGTGTLDDVGEVGSVFGIKALLADLRGLGATIFLTPATECGEALRAGPPPGLRLIKVSTLSGAVQALEALRMGKPVPTCSGS